MPKNRFQETIFTIMMVLVMVYAMICYNIAIETGGMKNFVFGAALGEWKDMLEPGTPVPTKPQTDEKLIYTKVGVYEGAGYTKKGIYRPTTECRMRINEAPVFCPVCQRSLERTIRFYTE